MIAKKKISILSLPILISLAVITISLAAAPASRPIADIFEISDQSNNLNFPAVGYNSNETYLVVWCFDGGTTKNIQGQAISRFGELSGNILDISPDETNIKRCKPDLAYSVFQNKYLVVWEYDDGVNRPNIRGIRHPGNIIVDEFTLGTGAALRSRYNPAVAYSTVSDKFLSVWESHVQGGISTDIEGQIIHGSGVLSGTNFLIATGDNNYSYDQPDVAYNPTRDEFLVVWRRENKADGYHDILGRRVAANGSIVDPGEIIIGWYTSDERNPAVAAIPSGGGGLYLVAWELIYPPSDHDIYGRMVWGNGATDTVFYPATSTDNETMPAIATNGANFLVSWTGAFEVLGIPCTGGFAWAVSPYGDLLYNQEWLGGFFVGETALTRGWNGDFLSVMDAFDVFFFSWDIWGRLWGERVYLPLVTR